ncbi:hypothetical protein KY309_01665 [Candidatus Woesearchaeota archaeon]|nr:hypothetical protein [Candidatus Woesearchaeota archaeon]MBW3016296.1 hypothetical protein [Candidatus Woesearchaeota archaeon]
MRLEDIKFIVTIILLGLSLLTALVLESYLKTGYAVQLVLILIGIILTAGIIFGLWIELEWAYPFTMLFFALALADMVWMFAETKAFLPFAFGLLVNVAGLVLCIASIETTALQELETYEIDKKRRK